MEGFKLEELLLTGLWNYHCESHGEWESYIKCASRTLPIEF